jgi:hypothetical protein
MYYLDAIILCGVPQNEIEMIYITNAQKVGV